MAWVQSLVGELRSFLQAALPGKEKAAVLVVGGFPGSPVRRLTSTAVGMVCSLIRKLGSKILHAMGRGVGWGNYGLGDWGIVGSHAILGLIPALPLSSY